jgi:hypothetical protein
MVRLAIALAALLVGFICVCALIAGSREDELRERLARSAELESQRKQATAVADRRTKTETVSDRAFRLGGWTDDTFI